MILSELEVYQLFSTQLRTYVAILPYHCSCSLQMLMNVPVVMEVVMMCVPIHKEAILVLVIKEASF